MAKVERVYNIPLRNEWLKAPSYKRAKKAMTAIREFLMKHMKSDNIKLGKHMNELVWERGIKHPPHHVKVNAVKYDDGLVRAEAFGFTIEEPKKSDKKEEKKAAGKEETKKEVKAAKKEKKTELKKEENEPKQSK